MASFLIVRSGTQQYALQRNGVYSVERVSGLISARSLGSLLGQAGPVEAYGLLLGQDFAATMVTISAVELMQTAEPLALPTFCKDLIHPAVTGFVVVEDELIPVLDATLL